MRSMGRIVVAVSGIVWLTAALTAAQSTTTSSETKQFEIIAVNGNDLVVKLPEGTRELLVPQDFRFNVDGRDMSLQELRPGMIGTAVITTRTTMTPVTVTEVRNGTVAQVGGGTIVVRTDQGLRSFNQGELDKRGIKIVRDGRPADVSDFRAGDTLTATIITTHPPTVVTEREVQATLARPPAADPVPAPIASSAVGTTGASLPKTAGPLPLIGLAGLISIAVGAALTARRRRGAR